MNLPGWNEQPDSDELSVQNKQLRHCYKTVLFKFSTNSGIYKKIMYERQKLNSLQKRYKDLTMHTRVLQVYLQTSKYGV